MEPERQAYHARTAQTSVSRLKQGSYVPQKVWQGGADGSGGDW